MIKQGVFKMKLKIHNQTLDIKKATDFKTRLLGFMGQEKINTGILFPNCKSIHTFFMKEEIDVIGLDDNNQVIYIYRNVPKNKIVKISSEQKKTSILELPKNTSKSLVIGSVIKFLE